MASRSGESSGMARQMGTLGSLFKARIERARRACARAGAAALLIGPSADLRYLTGYEALPLERMTLLALPVEGDPVLVVPALERARAEASPAPAVALIAPWGETDDPVPLVAEALPRGGGTLLVGDRLWAAFVLRLQEAFRRQRFGLASEVMRSLRVRKDAAEVDALRRAAAAADRVVEALGNEKVSGRSEREISRWISERLIEEGCEQVSFAIVASGPNAASPHHEPGGRLVAPGDALLVDFGGTVEGYGSDVSRTFAVGHAPDDLARIVEVVGAAQEAAVQAVRPGIPAEAVDAAARGLIEQAGFGERFVHRTGHGIGLEEHEDPYLVAGNTEPLEEGMAFSVEPGIYLEGRCGARIEDIVVVTDAGCERLNHAPRALRVLD